MNSKLAALAANGADLAEGLDGEYTITRAIEAGLDVNVRNNE